MRRVAVAAGALLAAASLVAAVPAGAQEDDVAAADLLRVVEQTPWVVPGGTFALRLGVDDAPPGAQLRVALHDRVQTRSEFVRTLDGEGLRRRLTGAEVVAVDELTQDGDGAIEARIVTGTVTGEEVDFDLDAEEEGVYPVVVDLLDADGEVVDRLVTHLVRLPDPDEDEHPLAAVVAVPLHAPPSHVAPGEIATEALAPLDVTLDALLAHPGAAATLLATPEAVAAAVEADPSAAERFRAAGEGRAVLDQTWVRLDEAAWARAGLGDELDRQAVAGNEVLAEAFGQRPDDAVAVIAAGAGQRAVDTAVADGAEVLLLPEADLLPLDEDDFNVTLTRPFDVEAARAPVTGLMVDAGLQARIGATGDAVLDAHRLLADLAVLALDAPLSPRAAVVVLDDEAATDAAFLDALLGGLDQQERVGAAPLVDPALVDEVVAGVDPATPDGAAASDDDDERLVRVLAATEAPRPSLAGLRDALAAARADLRSYRSVFGPDDPLAAEVEELVLTAGAASLGPAERDRLLETGVRALTERLDGIHGPPRQQITLTAREGQVQLVFGNDTGAPADVAVELRGDRLEFPGRDDRRLVVHLPEGTTRVDLDLRARSSGDAPLDLRLTTPDGRIELGQSRITVRTTAFSGVGLLLLGAAALFLVVWWTRTIVRERGAGRRRHPAHAAPSG